MRKWIFISFLLIATRAEAQQINLSVLDKIGARAKEKTELTFDESMLKFASGFLSDKNKEEAAAKQITEGLKGLYVRVYEFDKPGQFSPADLDPIRAQLKGPQWFRIINVQDQDGDDVQIWIYRDGTNNTGGMLLMAIEPEEIAVVYIVGPISADDVKKLGGQFGIPRIDNLNLVR